MNKQDIYNFCKSIAKKEHVEFIYSTKKKQQIAIEKFDISKPETNESSALFIRVIVNGQTGTYTITDISKENILKSIGKARKIASLKNDIKIPDFGNAKESRKINYDKEIKQVDFTEYLQEIKSQIIKDKYIQAYEGEFSKSDVNSFYINPYTCREEEASKVSLFVDIITKDKKTSNAGFFDIFTTAKDIDISNTFLQARYDANLLLNPEAGKKGECDLILTPIKTKSLLEGLVISKTDGESIEKKESFLHDYVGKKVFSENLTITEDPHLNNFLGSSTIDDEGFKTQEKKIFNRGVFKTTIYDQYNAIKYHKKNTGNGFRSGPSITCDHTNLIQTPGKNSIDNIISETKKGILVYSLMGMHTNSGATGDFSLTLALGKEIENGKFKRTVTNVNFTGNIASTLKDASFSKEQKFFGDSLYSFCKIPKVKLI